MAKTLVGALALASLPSVLAFRNTSPFFLFSTADLNINGNDADLALSSTVASKVTDMLNKCPTKKYFVVRQEGVASTDYADSLVTPRLASYMGGHFSAVKSTMAISEALGEIDMDVISSQLKSNCGAEIVRVDMSKVDMPSRSQESSPQVIEVTLPAPPATQRIAVLESHDAFLEQIIINFAENNHYTVIYTTTARIDAPVAATPDPTYSMDDPFDNAIQMELKRDTSTYRRQAKSPEGGLFEKYQFFSPALFMGFAAVIPLFLVLYVGLNALTSLEVSYMAFSKEMGPAAQRKQ